MNGTENMNKKLFWRCIVVSLIWSFVLVAIDCISNSRYFLSFLLLWTSNFLVVLLPPLLYRYKWRTFPTRVGILGTCVVLVLNKFIAFLAGMGLYSLFKALLPEAGFAKPYTRIDIYSVFWAVLWAIPVWWILRHVDKLPDGFGRYLWTEILRLLPEELKWEEIESTDFGEMLRVIYENGMCSNISLDRLPSFIVMSAVLSVLEERLNQVGLFAYLYASPGNQVLCDFAEKLLADIYRLGYVKKEYYQKQFVRLAAIRTALFCNKKK